MKTEKPDRPQNPESPKDLPKETAPLPPLTRKKILNKEKANPKLNKKLNDFRYLSRRNNTLWFFILGVALLVGGIGLWAMSRLQDPVPQEAETPQETSPAAALPVRVVEATRAPIQAWVFGEGLSRAVRFKHLTFNSRGTITFVKKINGRELREGDFVRQGEVLALVDRRTSNADLRVRRAGLLEAHTQVSQARASLEQAIEGQAEAEAALEQAEASLVEAEANLQMRKNDRDLAQVEFESRQDLRAEGVIPENELITYETNLKNAEEAIGGAESQVSAAERQVEVAEARVRSSQKQVDANIAGCNPPKSGSIAPMQNCRKCASIAKIPPSLPPLTARSPI